MTDNRIPTAIAEQLHERKAQNIVCLRVAHLTVLADYLVIATGHNALQVKALADYIDMKCVEMGLELRRQEGAGEGRWIVLDYGSVIVHIFHREDREFYRLDRLWDDGGNRLPLPFDKEEDEQ